MKEIKRKNKVIIMSLSVVMLLFVSVSNVNAAEVNLEDNVNYAKEVNSIKYEKRISKFLEQASTELKKIYEEQPFMIGEEWFDKQGNLISIQSYDVKYVETTTYIDKNNSNEDIVTQKQLTSEEYDNWAPIQTRSSCDYWGSADCWETTAKRIVIIY